MKIISWNVNKVCTKLEKQNVFSMLSEYDIIALSEVKTQLPIHLPGYITYRGKTVGIPSRGGIVVLVRNSLSKFVYNVDSSIGDQIWMQFSNVADVMFGFCYVPPSDSQYFSLDVFAAMKRKIMYSHAKNGCIIMGDMNARFGKAVRDLIELCELPGLNISYPIIEDCVDMKNDNAEFLSAICLDHNFIVLNNLKVEDKHFVIGKTFRKRDVWVSELDTCVLSPELVNYVKQFGSIKRADLPSDHAPICMTLCSPGLHVDNVLERASLLGDHAVLYGSATGCRVVKKPINFCYVDKQRFADRLTSVAIPSVPEENDVNVFARNITEVLYGCVEGSKRTPTPGVRQGNQHLGRWERILNDSDDTRVWKAINWKGELEGVKNDMDILPSDEDFKTHFESVLNPSPAPPPPQIGTDVTIPVLDDPISPQEVDCQIRKMKVDKACGPDGLTPGVFSLLPLHWVLTITTLFNAIFMSGVYPVSWVRAVMFMIYKRGSKSDANNYRGISIINSLAKLFDMVLCRRLNYWFRPFREQAGAQSRRGCLEHIVSLRLLTDMARRKKRKLFVTFVDFSKAYDMVPRNKLFCILKRLGCGMLMLAILTAMYSVTESVIGGAVVTATLGVRQGSPTSCFLFVVFMNELIRMLRDRCVPDGFLGWLHTLVLMDDTVLLSTSREGMISKIRILKEYCTEHGMIINVLKTKFFVISGTEGDAGPLCVDGLTIEPCTSYIYLGSPFTSDGSVSSAVQCHAKNKLSHVLKFVSFVNKNNDTPFIVKRRVFEAALMSGILYGCESWIGADLKPIVKLYNWSLKQLLGVRKTTPNDVCYAEAGYPSLPDLVRLKQHMFFSRMVSERSDLRDDPLMFTIELVNRDNTTTSRIIREYCIRNVPDSKSLIRNVYDRIAASNGSRCVVYRTMNPGYVTHSVYKDRHTVNDRHRISFTRFRVSGHSLCIESGRWNRRGRGRLPVEERLCLCGEIQTEKHVVEDCPVSADIRQAFDLSSLEELFNGKYPNELSCKIIHDILQLYA